MIARRLLVLMPLGLLACRERAAPLAPRLQGYGYLTPLRLNVADLEVIDAPAGAASRADLPAPLIPAVEVARMGRDRVLPSGTTGRARFVTEVATLTRDRDRLAVFLRARVEVLDDGRRVAFAEAESRRSATEGAGTAAAAQRIVGQAMDELNVEFELQVRRNLRDWLLDTTPTAPIVPLDAPGGIQRQDLPQG